MKVWVNKSMAEPQEGPSWKLRRRAVFASMLFGAAIVAYVAWQWDDLRIAETLALGGFGLIGTVVAAYIGGAAYEDARLFLPDKKGRQHD
jgi:uncharacterized membrane protein